MRWKVKDLTLAWLATLVATPACTGSVGEPNEMGAEAPILEPDADSDAAPIVRLKAAGAELHAVEPALPEMRSLDRSASCNEEDIAPTRVRPLSPREYENTLTDLLTSTAENVELPDVELPSVVKVHGFENYAEQLTPTAVLVERQLDIALDAAEALHATGTGADLQDCSDDASACVEPLLHELGRLALRRPLSTEELSRYSGFFAERSAALGREAATQLTLAALLQAPQFSYRLETSRRAPVDEVLEPTPDHIDKYEMASRLSYLIWQTAPDDELLDLAEAGELGSLNEIKAQAERMLDDPRAASAYADFHRQWLGLDRVLDEPKSGELFPSWQAETASAAIGEAERFFELLYTSDEPTLMNVLTSPQAVVNDELAAIYGVEPTGEWHEVTLDANQRAGILTRVGFLAGNAHDVASPPLRGVSVLRNLLCAPPPAPPASVDTSVPVASDGAPTTNRERFEAKLSASPSCPGCHTRIDGLGYTFERYDAIGRYRTTEPPDLTIDPSGELIGTDVDGPVDDALELSARLAESRQVNYCAALNLYRYAQGRDERAQDWCKTDRVYDALTENGGDLRDALFAIATSYEFRHRLLEPPQSTTSAPIAEESE